METVVLWVTLIGGILGIGAIVLKWGPPLKRFRDWLYRHTNRYRIEQLQEQVRELQERLSAIDRTADALMGISKSQDKIMELHVEKLQTQLDNQDSRLTETNASLARLRPYSETRAALMRSHC